jgi:hypothetical protein
MASVFNNEQIYIDEATRNAYLPTSRSIDQPEYICPAKFTITAGDDRREAVAMFHRKLIEEAQRADNWHNVRHVEGMDYLL